MPSHGLKRTHNAKYAAFKSFYVKRLTFIERQVMKYSKENDWKLDSIAKTITLAPYLRDSMVITKILELVKAHVYGLHKNNGLCSDYSQY